METLKDLLGLGSNDVEDATLTEADESMIFLTALRDECTPEEFEEIVTKNATTLEAYGLISKADIATEAQRNIVKLNNVASFNRIQKRTAIRLAAESNDQLYEKYAKFRKLMIEYRVKIYQKYGNKAKSEARRIISNAGRKAKAIPSSVGNVGKSIGEKMDNAVKKFNSDKK